MSDSSLTNEQRKALRQLLQSVEEQEKWDYFKRGGWAGQRLYALLEEPADEPVERQLCIQCTGWLDEHRHWCPSLKSGESLPPCECLLLDKEPSAYHALKCPRYVADAL